MKFNIGDTVFHATFYPTTTKWVECPVCMGEGRVQVIYGGGKQASIACDYCSLGYTPPTGKVKIYAALAHAEPLVITGVELEAGGKERYNYIDSSELFKTKEEAFKRAEEKAEEYKKKEVARLKEKEKPNKSWSWHVGYHKREIKRLQKNIDQHQARLEAANLKAKS